MPTWWLRILHRFGNAQAGQQLAELSLSAAAEEFLRPSRYDHVVTDQSAICKAMVLLEKALTLEQRSDLFTRGCFYVKGNRFTYRIREGVSANVDALDSTGAVISRFCARPFGHSPVYDVLLAQKLWIETDEDMFLKLAHRVRRS